MTQERLAPLTPSGWRDVSIGTELGTIIEQYGDGRSEWELRDDAECVYFHPPQAPEGLAVMAEQGVVTRVSLWGGEIETIHGLGIGATADEVLAALPGALVSPHKYDNDPAAYYTVWEGDVTIEEGNYVTDEDARGIRYIATSDGTITQISAGSPSIQYVEGCS